MKNVKNFIIYGVIILLCVCAFVGFLADGWGDRKVIAGKGTEEKSEVERQEHIKTIMGKAVKEPDSNPLVGIGLGDVYETVTAEAVKNAGGLESIIKKGDTVLIKPNICTVAAEGTPLITDYRGVGQIVRMVKEFGAAKVIIAEGSISGNAFNELSLKINKYGTIKGVETININDIEKEDCYELKPYKSTTGKAFYIPKVYMDADVVINVAKLKTHSQAVVTLSLKNAFGIPSAKVYGGSGLKSGLHALGMEKSIVDLNFIRKPDLSIIEGMVGGEGYGPINNMPVKSNIIFAGRDRVALDTIALTFMGFKVDQVPHVKLAAEMNMGISDLDSIKVVGGDLEAIKMDFQSEFK